MSVDIVLKTMHPVMPRGAQPSAQEFITAQQLIQDSLATIIKYLQTLSPGGEITHDSTTHRDTDGHTQYHTDARGDARYAPIAKGVTNGDSHDHIGGDGAQIDHAGLANKGTTTHAQIDTHVAGTAKAQHALGVGTHDHQSAGAEGGQLVHGSACTAASLALDSHSGYAWLAGRSGGQTFNGDTASGGSAIVKGTSHATPGPVQLNPSGGSIGVGTATAPHGGVGGGLLAVEGANASISAGPHVQFTTASDNYPLLQMLSWQHDDIEFWFDAYYDGTDYHASDTSAFGIGKVGDTLRFYANGSLTAGNSFSPTNRAGITAVGLVWVGASTAASGFSPGLLLVSRAATDNGYSAEIDSTGNGTTNRSCLALSCGSAASEGTNTYYFIDAYSGTTNTGTIKAVNGTFQLADISDERLKEHIAPTKINGLNVISRLNVVEFAYKKHHKDKADHKCGLIAQNVQQAFDEAVSPGRDGYLQLAKSELTPVLIKALQELLDRVVLIEQKMGSK